MSYAGMMFVCVSAVLTPQTFDIYVPKLAAIVQGQYMRMEVQLTYRGRQKIFVDRFRFDRPCAYWLPMDWKPTFKPYMLLAQGVGPVTVENGTKTTQMIDLRHKHDFTEKPGKYEIQIQCYMPGSFTPDGPKLCHVSKRIKVPIEIVAPQK